MEVDLPGDILGKLVTFLHDNRLELFHKGICPGRRKFRRSLCLTQILVLNLVTISVLLLRQNLARQA